VGPGVVLIILGAILAFDVHGDLGAVDLQMVGVIFLIAGGVLVHFARNATRARKVTKVEDLSDPTHPVQTVTEEVAEHDPYDRLHGELQGDTRRPPS
jgi:membrane protein implicated in regulation of membrane protease activity